MTCEEEVCHASRASSDDKSPPDTFKAKPESESHEIGGWDGANHLVDGGPQEAVFSFSESEIHKRRRQTYTQERDTKGGYLNEVANSVNQAGVVGCESK